MGSLIVREVTATVTHLPDSIPVLLTSVLDVVRRDGAERMQGRLVETSGPSGGWRLVIETPLSTEDGNRLLGMFLPSGPDSPPWE